MFSGGTEGDDVVAATHRCRTLEVFWHTGKKYSENTQNQTGEEQEAIIVLADRDILS